MFALLTVLLYRPKLSEDKFELRSVLYLDFEEFVYKRLFTC